MRSERLIVVGAMLMSAPIIAQETDWQDDAIARAIDYHLENPPELCEELLEQAVRSIANSELEKARRGAP